MRIIRSASVLGSTIGTAEIDDLAVTVAKLAGGITAAKLDSAIANAAFAAASTCTGAGAWEDWDLSATIPAGARFAIIREDRTTDATTTAAGVRPDGSATDWSTVGINGGTRYYFVPLTSTRFVERFCASDVNRATFRLVFWI